MHKYCLTLGRNTPVILTNPFTRGMGNLEYWSMNFCFLLSNSACDSFVNTLPIFPFSLNFIPK